MASTEERIRSIIVDQVGCEESEVTADAAFEDLGLDSFDAIELVMAFEAEWGIEIPDEDAERILSVQDAITYIESKVS
jgi:acyl carrier protein